MSNLIINNQEVEVSEAKVSSEFNEAKQLAKSMNIDEVKSGGWFVNLLQKVIQDT